MTMMVMYSAMTGSAYIIVIGSQYVSEIVRTSVRTVSSLRQFILDGLLDKMINSECRQRQTRLDTLEEQWHVLLQL